MSSFDYLKDLKPADVRTIMLAKVYELERKKTQGGYRVLDLTKDPTNHVNFKCFKTVEAWLDEKGAKVRWDNPTWSDYVAFVFSKLSPSIPQPGQLKNQLLLREYLASQPNLADDADQIKLSKLEALYRRILLPEIANNPGLMEALGLRNINLREED